MTFVVYNTANHIRSNIEIKKVEGTYFVNDETGIGSIINEIELFTMFCYNAETDIIDIDSPVTPIPLPDQTSKDLDYYKIIGNTAKLSIIFNAVPIPYMTTNDYSNLRSTDPLLPTNILDGTSHVKTTSYFDIKNNFSEPVQTAEDVRHFMVRHFEPKINEKYYIYFYDRKWDSKPNNPNSIYFNKRVYEGILTKINAQRTKSDRQFLYTITLNYLIGKDIVIDEIPQEDDEEP